MWHWHGPWCTSATFPAILVLPVLHFSLDMEDSNDISAACRQAADALEILSNLRPGFARNVVPRLNSSPTVGQKNSEGRAAVESTLSSASVSSPPVSSTAQIATRLATCFPTLGANRSNNRTRRSARPKLSAKAKSVRGRPAKSFVYRDLVLLPSPALPINEIDDRKFNRYMDINRWN